MIFFNKNIFFIKILLITTVGFIAFFIDKNNHLFHWSWVIYFLTTVLLLVIEFCDHNAKNMKPLDKAKKFLDNLDSWKMSDANNNSYYYEPSPEFTIRTNYENNNLDYTQEWTRGEIGSSYTTGNSAYYDEIYFNHILLKQIHIVVFDGGKKYIVAPNWEAIGTGRIYYYLCDSIEYFYQKYITSRFQVDHSKNINKSMSCSSFDIPVFKNKKELDIFIRLYNKETSCNPETNKEEQTRIFYALLEKYQNFKQQKTTNNLT